MQEIKQEKLYQAGKVDQGFNPFKAADVTPLLRENQQTEQAQMRAVQDQQMRDVKLANQSERLALKTAQQEQNLKQYVAKMEDLQESRDMQQLSQFSNKLFDVVHQVREQRYKDRQAEIQVLFSEDEAARQEAELLQKINEDQLSVMAAGDMALAQEAAKNDEPYSYVQRMRTLSGEDRYLYATAHAAKVGESFKSFATTQMVENQGFITLKNGHQIKINNPRDEAEASAVIGHLLKEHIKNNDAENLPPGLTATYIYKQTDKARADLLSDFSADYAVREGFVDRQLKFEEVKARTLANPEDPNIIQDYLNTVALTMNEAGTKRLRYPGAHDEFFKELLVLGQSEKTEDQLLADQLLDSYGELTLNGKKFKILHADRIRKYRQSLAGAISDDLKLTKQAKKEKADAAIEDMISRLGSQFTKADVIPIMDFASSAYLGFSETYNLEPLKKLWAQASLDGQTLRDLRTNIDTKFTHGRMTLEDWNRLPPTLQEEYSAKWVQHQKLQGATFAPYKESIEQMVDGNPYVSAAGKAGRILSPLVKREMLREFDQIVANLQSKEDSPYRDDDAAGARATEILTKRFTEGVNQEGHRYQVTPTGGFENYLFFGTDAKELTAKQRERQNLVNQMAQNVGRRAWSSPQLIGTAEQIRGMKERYESGRGVDPFLRTIAQRNGLSWMEVLNMQLEAQGDDKVELIEQILQVTNQQTPDIQRQIRGVANGYFNSIQQDRLRGARYVRPMYSNMIASTPPRDRLVNAIVDQESSGNPNAVNSRTGASGLIQVLPENIPSWTQRYLGVRMTPAQYRADVAAQNQLAVAYFSELVQQHTAPGRSQEEIIRRVAAHHYGGSGAVDHWDNPGYHSRSGPYNPGNEPNMQEYTASIWAKYQGGM